MKSYGIFAKQCGILAKLQHLTKLKIFMISVFT